MGLATIRSRAAVGIEAPQVSVEANLASALPIFSYRGRADDCTDLCEVLHFTHPWQEGHFMSFRDIGRPARGRFMHFVQVVDVTATALLYQELGRCRGNTQSTVLRERTGALVRNAWCLEPQDIHDAIHQALTPLEFMLDQLNGRLVARRSIQ